MKVKIGSRVPPRTSMFESRDGMGGYQHAMPPMSKDSELLQASLLNRGKQLEEEKGWRWVAPAFKIVSAIMIFGLLWLIFEMQ